MCHAGLTSKRKRPRSFLNVAFIYAGNDLLSHSLSRAVQSALRGLTSVFGMETPRLLLRWKLDLRIAAAQSALRSSLPCS